MKGTPTPLRLIIKDFFFFSSGGYAVLRIRFKTSRCRERQVQGPLFWSRSSRLRHRGQDAGAGAGYGFVGGEGRGSHQELSHHDSPVVLSLICPPLGKVWEQGLVSTSASRGCHSRSCIGDRSVLFRPLAREQGSRPRLWGSRCAPAGLENRSQPFCDVGESSTGGAWTSIG